ncbi:phytoene/squalene synthase family protein [Lysobacter sp. TY2-98]|uniref:phytoene/squalene synthase family protein n=1 Tax=Lysobacter sp. TY2-98 TaxID=2290922 RepID=UPI000E202C72|nr:phytoene/squalene synthase family protein [Lysobacter sp. TY2-98]AXK72264.1 phytoene/squalene synthase family protein [Lysobacter sp. TY2-98]
MSDHDAHPAGDAAAFVAKWRGAWPEWALVERFVPASQREVVDAWQALQFEWQEAAWRGDDARPGEAKLRWWVDELAGWSKGIRRHPLGAVLQKQPVAWEKLAQTLPSLLAARFRPRDAAEAREQLQRVARAIAQSERVLLDRSDTEAVIACWLHARLARHPGDAVPTEFTSHDDAAARWSRALLAHWPSARLSPSRGIALSLARARLASGRPDAPLSPWSALWAGWRGARG